MTDTVDDPVALAETYYDSDDADRFYFHVWGGEDIHIGLYETPDEPIAQASRRTVEAMADRLEHAVGERPGSSMGPHTRVLDLGAGYGGAARYLATRFGCQVTCLNLSETQNARNRQRNTEAGLQDRVSVVHGNFERIPEPDASYDVVWSQDAILHSGDRVGVMREVRRVLKPGGDFIFTDPMQADEVPPGALSNVLARIHLESMGSVAFYRDTAASLGMAPQPFSLMPAQLTRHYSRVRAELSRRQAELRSVVSEDYLTRMLAGLGHWVDASTAGHLNWGILHFRVTA